MGPRHIEPDSGTGYGQTSAGIGLEEDRHQRRDQRYLAGPLTLCGYNTDGGQDKQPGMEQQRADRQPARDAIDRNAGEQGDE